METTSILTEEQSTLVAGIINEFAKLNMTKPDSAGGLIDVDLIKSNYDKKVKRQQEIDSIYRGYYKLLLKTLEQDCEKLNVELCRLGMYAFQHHTNYLSIEPVKLKGLCAGGLMFAYEVTYCTEKATNSKIANGIRIRFKNLTFDSIEELMKAEKIINGITYMYENLCEKQILD